MRIAEVNRNAELTGTVDIAPNDLGNWENSGFIDMSALFNSRATILLINVQAHSKKGDLFGGNNASSELVEGGLMVLLRQLRHSQKCKCSIGGRLRPPLLFSREAPPIIASPHPTPSR